MDSCVCIRLTKTWHTIWSSSRHQDSLRCKNEQMTGWCGPGWTPNASRTSGGAEKWQWQNNYYSQYKQALDGCVRCCYCVHWLGGWQGILAVHTHTHLARQGGAVVGVSMPDVILRMLQLQSRSVGTWLWPPQSCMGVALVHCSQRCLPAFQADDLHRSFYERAIEPCITLAGQVKVITISDWLQSAWLTSARRRNNAYPFLLYLCMASYVCWIDLLPTGPASESRRGL